MAAACSEDQVVVQPTAGVVRPRLQAAGVPRYAEPRSVVATFDPGAEPARYLVDAASKRAIVLDGERLLACDGQEPKSIEIPLKEPRRFTHVATRLLIRRGDALAVELAQEGRTVHLAEVPLGLDERTQTIVVEFPLYVDTFACDSMRLVVRGGGPVVFGRVDLIDMPLVDRLPRPERGADMITIGDDLRRGVGLSSEQGLEFSLSAPQGGEVGFSYGMPEVLRRDSEQPELVVLLRSPGLPERRHVLPFEDADTTTIWHWARIPIGEFAGKPLQVRFELFSRDGRPALCALTEPKVHVPERDDRTVLLVTSDTHRADRLGSAGGHVQTPVLDALAARGLSFERAFSATNVTLPSHTAMLSGRHPRDTRLVDNNMRLGEEAWTLAEAFREAGWQTIAAVSAAHLAHEWSGLGQGFDRMLVTRAPDRRAGETITYLNRSLEELDGRPLFVWVHLFDAHAPYLPPPGYAERYYEGDAWDPTLPDPAVDPLHLPPFLPGVRDLAYVTAAYDGETSYLDGELARLLERPRIRRGITAFTADHGESFGEHGVYWDHAELYPQTVRVPLLLAWPGAPAGTRVGTPVSNLDLGRTLLDLAGEQQVPFPGRNLRLALEPKETRPLHLISSHGTSAAIVHWPWLLVLHLQDHRPDPQNVGAIKAAHSHELYDLDSDPDCVLDLARQDRAKAGELRADLVAWLRSGENLGWTTRNRHDAAMRDNLQALGYAGSYEGGAEEAPEWFPSGCGCRECAEVP